jgi:uncharacterized membrane protein YbhN (UPF0104 family)
LTEEIAAPSLQDFSKGQLSIGKVVAILLKIAVTIGCFWYISRQINVADLRSGLASLDVRWASLATALLFLQIPLLALRWFEILNVTKATGDRVTYKGTLVATIMGQFVSQVLPTAIGDAVRVWYVSRLGRDWRNGTMSVVIDRCIGIGLLLAFAFFILLWPSRLDVLGGYRLEVLSVFGAILVLSVIALEFGARLAPILTRWTYARWLAALFVASRSVVFGWRGPSIIGVGCLIHVLTIATVWSLGRALGLSLTMADAAVLFTIMIGVGLVPISISGWGLREFAVVSLLGSYGMSPERALTFSMYFGLAGVIASLPGAFAWIVFSMPRAVRPRQD